MKSRFIVVPALACVLLVGCSKEHVDNVPFPSPPSNVEQPEVERTPIPRLPEDEVTYVTLPTAVPMEAVKKEDTDKLGLASDIGMYKVVDGEIQASAEVLTQLADREVLSPIDLSPIVTEESTGKDFDSVIQVMEDTLPDEHFTEESVIIDGSEVTITLTSEERTYSNLKMNKDGMWEGTVISASTGEVLEENFIWNPTGEDISDQKNDTSIMIIGDAVVINPYYFKLAKTMASGLDYLSHVTDTSYEIRVVDGHVVIDLSNKVVSVYGIGLQEDGTWKGMYNDGRHTSIFEWTPPSIIEIQYAAGLD